MKELPKVRFRMAWRQFSKGTVIQPTGLYRDMLLQNGIVELVEESVAVQAPVPEVEAREEVKPVEKPNRRGKKHGSHDHSAAGLGTVDGGRSEAALPD